ncbi:CotO family spore coat protein [Jeotgalibacillus terrae]|uniref:CotO family spore coat protein n=1 Tax=Jeotgalibacillus terrae TaxID=587735 RepID=A0ABW5ZER3_9BACL|nr:hypothetical protein [Jeotgalibacillus terrae]MBM7578250.1 hypothetical protein [Jeotgalibacillus terrae]
MHKKGRPLLYVNQPEFPEIKPVMQHYYQAPITKEKAPVKKPKVPPLGYIEESEKELSPEEPGKEQTFSFRELKPFKKMTLPEKIDYLGAFEGRRAPFQCRFVKEDGSEVHGIITSKNKHDLSIKTLKGEDLQLERNEVLDIQIY